MIHNPSKSLVAVAATLLLTASAAFAEREVKRLDHPNGRSTYIVKPTNRGATVGVYAREQGIATDSSDEVQRSKYRPTRINMGRGQYIRIHGNNR